MKLRRPVTIEDMYRMPEDGRKYELVDGEVVVSPGGAYHGEVVVKIVHIIAAFLDDHPIGKVYADNVGLVFPNGNLRSPDVFFVKSEKLPGRQSPVTFGEFVPDLAVEVLSPGDRPAQVSAKIAEFLECGVPIVWLVDPQARTVVIHRPDGFTHKLSEHDTIDAEPVLTGFTCVVSRFF